MDNLMNPGSENDSDDEDPSCTPLALRMYFDKDDDEAEIPPETERSQLLTSNVKEEAQSLASSPIISDKQLMEEIKEMRRDVAQMRAAQEMPAPAPVQALNTTQAPELEDILRVVMEQAGAMVDAYIESIEERLLPKKHLGLTGRRREAAKTPATTDISTAHASVPSTSRAPAPNQAKAQRGEKKTKNSLVAAPAAADSLTTCTSVSSTPRAPALRDKALNGGKKVNDSPSATPAVANRTEADVSVLSTRAPAISQAKTPVGRVMAKVSPAAVPAAEDTLTVDAPVPSTSRAPAPGQARAPTGGKRRKDSPAAVPAAAEKSLQAPQLDDILRVVMEQAGAMVDAYMESIEERLLPKKYLGLTGRRREAAKISATTDISAAHAPVPSTSRAPAPYQAKAQRGEKKTKECLLAAPAAADSLTTCTSVSSTPRAPARRDKALNGGKKVNDSPAATPAVANRTAADVSVLSTRAPAINQATGLPAAEDTLTVDAAVPSTSRAPAPGQARAPTGGKRRNDSPAAVPAAADKSVANTPVPERIIRGEPRPHVQEEQWTTAVRRDAKKTAPEKKPSTPDRAQRGAPVRAKEAKRGKRKKKKVSLRLPRTAAVVIKLQPEAVERGLTYAQVLTEARGRIDLAALGVPPLTIRMAATGARVLEIVGPDMADKADSLAGKLREVFSEVEDVRISRPVATADLRVVGLNDSVGPEELLGAIAKAGGCTEAAIKLGEIRRGPAGMGTAFFRCPIPAARAIVAGRSRLLVGWVSAPVQILEKRPRRCYRCLAAGHVSAQCTSKVDRSSDCYRCGVTGHKARDCSAAPHCPACEDAGKLAGHIVRGKVCAKPPLKRTRRRVVAAAIARSPPLRHGAGGGHGCKLGLP